MSAEQIRSFFDACNRRDIDAIESCFTDDAVYFGSIGPDDDGTRFVGRSEVRRGMAAFLGQHSRVDYSDLDIVVAGERGFATWTFAGTMLGGDSYHYRGVDVFSFEGALIARKDAFRKERAAAIGTSPAT